MGQALAAQMDQGRVAEQAGRAAEQAERAVEAGQRATEQAMRDIEKLKSKDFGQWQEQFEKNKDFGQWQGKLRDAQSEGSQAELQALREARESLQTQIKTLERQIHRLEENQKRLDKPGQSNNSDDGPKAEKPVSVKAS
jgi:polyhydroxyalkanoate synthesis regulator phasin